MLITRQLRKPLIFSFIIFCFISSLLYIKIHRIMPSERMHCDIDSKAYDYFANLFVASNSMIDPNNPTNLTSIALGYPLILGLIYKFFGFNHSFVILIQILLCILSIWLICKISLLLFNVQVATIATYLAAINIGFLVYCQYILTEIVLMTLLLAFCERFISFYKQRSLNSLAAAGFLLGCSIAIKPAAILYPLAILPILFFSSKSLKSTIYSILTFLVFFSAIPAAYLIRNKTEYNKISICSLAHTNLKNFFLPKLISEKEKITETEALSKIQTSSNISDIILEEIRNNPYIAFSIWMKNVMKTFFGLHLTALKVLINPNLKGGDCSFFKVDGNSLIEKSINYIKFGTTSKIELILGFFEIIFNMLRYFFLLTALCYLIISKRWFLVSFIFSYISYFALISGHDGCGRFRMMFEPILIIFSSFGIYLLYIIISKSEKLINLEQKVNEEQSANIYPNL